MLSLHLVDEVEMDLRMVETYLFTSLNGSDALFEKSFKYLLKSGGKRIRPAFTLLAARYSKENSRDIVPLAAALEMVHMASLVHDDVVDASDLRRGKPTIRKLYGNDFSLHLGVFIFARAMEIIGRYDNHELNSMLALAGFRMCQGEMEQLVYSNFLQTNLKQYLCNIRRKTASLFTASCVAGALAAGADQFLLQALRRYGHNLGMAYQITDDVLDFTAAEKTLGKPVGSDYRQGIITLPLIYVFKNGSSAAKEALLQIFSTRQFNVLNTQRIFEIVTESGALIYSLNVANKFVGKALKAIEKLPANSSTETFKKIATALYNRVD